MISCAKVTKSFARRKGAAALSEFTASFPSKGLVFVVGAMGAGKSTLLHILSGSIKPTNGSVTFRPKYPAIAFCYQTENLIAGLSAGENLFLFSKRKDRDWGRALRCFESVGLNGDDFYEKCEDMNALDQQKLALARALYMGASIVLCDEPAALLGKEDGEQLYGLLKKLSEDRLVIVATRDKSAAKKNSNHILTLQKGRIVSSSLPTEDTGAPCEEKKRKTLGLSALTRLFCKQALKHPVTFSFPLLYTAVMLAGFSFASGFVSGISDRDIARSVLDSGITNVLYQKEKEHQKDASGMNLGLSWGYEDWEKDEIETEIGLPSVPVYGLPDGYFLGSFPSSTKSGPFVFDPRLSSSNVYWAIPATENNLMTLGFSLYAGRLPSSPNELALPLWQFQEMFHDPNEPITASANEKEKPKAEDYLSSEPRLEAVGAFRKVVGIIDTNLDPSIYGKAAGETNPWVYSPSETFRHWVASKNLHTAFYVSEDFPPVLSSALHEVGGIKRGEVILRSEDVMKEITAFENTSSKSKRARPVAYFAPEKSGMCVTSDVLRTMFKDVLFDFDYYDASGISLLNLPKLCDLPMKTKVTGSDLFGEISTQEDWCHDAFVFSACCKFCQSHWSEGLAEKMTMVVTNFYKANQFNPIDFSLPENEERLKLASAILLSSDGLSIRRTDESTYYGGLPDGGAFYANNRIPLEFSGKDIAVEAFQKLNLLHPLDARPVSIALETIEGRHEIDLAVRGYCIYPTNEKDRASVAFDFSLPEYESLCVHFPKGRTTVAFASKTPDLGTLEKMAGQYGQDNKDGLATYAQIPQFLLRNVRNSEKNARSSRSVFLALSVLACGGVIALPFLSWARLRGKPKAVGLISCSGYRFGHIFLFVGLPGLLCCGIGLLLGTAITAVGITLVNTAFLSANGLHVPLLGPSPWFGVGAGLACVGLTALTGLLSSWINRKRGVVHYLSLKSAARDASDAEKRKIIKTLRTESQTSQAQLADALSISRTLVAKWETGKAPINKIYEEKIWSFFKVSPPKMASQPVTPIRFEDPSDSKRIRLCSLILALVFSSILAVCAITRIALPLTDVPNYDVVLLVLSSLAFLFSLVQLLALLFIKENR